MTAFVDKYGPWALVAGASEGLGAAFAESLAKRNVNLILVARRGDLLNALAVKLSTGYGIEATTQPFDLADTARLPEFIESLSVPVGLLVYNAAFAPVGDFANIQTELLQRVVDINITAPLLMSRLLAPAMIARSRGGIILMSSLAGDQGSPRISAYAASKAFNAVLAEGLWGELRTQGVDVIASRAGAIRTPGYLAKGTAEAPGTLDAAEVAEQTLSALGKAPSVVPGAINKLASFVLTRLAPRKAAISIMASNTRDLT
ncbi:MAG TPA: SDR family NAD(P)-dependent oxidoreductase [Pseudomonadales bacterium]|nr:SDR family NAD(P)-dependent oxidoreductase [Pseudomonadales bacterium]